MVWHRGSVTINALASRVCSGSEGGGGRQTMGGCSCFNGFKKKKDVWVESIWTDQTRTKQVLLTRLTYLQKAVVYIHNKTDYNYESTKTQNNHNACKLALFMFCSSESVFGCVPLILIFYELSSLVCSKKTPSKVNAVTDNACVMMWPSGRWRL